MLKNRKKIIFALFFVVISVVFFSRSFERKEISDVEVEKNAGDVVQVETSESVLGASNPLSVSKVATTSKIAKKSQNAEIIIFNKKTDFSFEKGDSLFDAMNELKNSGQINFSGKEFVSMGYFIEEINGVKQNPREREYWHYYANGVEASVGISTYQLKNNDSIEWKLEVYK